MARTKKPGPWIQFSPGQLGWGLESHGIPTTLCEIKRNLLQTGAGARAMGAGQGPRLSGDKGPVGEAFWGGRGSGAGPGKHGKRRKLRHGIRFAKGCKTARGPGPRAWAPAPGLGAGGQEGPGGPGQ